MVDYISDSNHVQLCSWYKTHYLLFIEYNMWNNNISTYNVCYLHMTATTLIGNWRRSCVEKNAPLNNIYVTWSYKEFNIKLLKHTTIISKRHQRKFKK